MSIGFQVVHGSIVIIRHKLVWKQTEAYRRNGELYVKACGGFVRLRPNNKTTHPDISWEEVEGIDVKKIKENFQKKPARKSRATK